MCGAANLSKAGQATYYIEGPIDVFDCPGCGSRQTGYIESTYEDFHSNANSGYGVYRDLADHTKALFDKGDRTGLRQSLFDLSKYKFIIEHVERLGKQARLLEIGCSRGYLTSYFILAGYDITGVDISPTAVTAAAEHFGPHFRVVGDPQIAARAPYDAIFHTGTIGCVGDPVGITRSLMDMLKSGGTLLFNAPNFHACRQKDQLWIDVCPPPDLVTMFKPGFWARMFSADAQVSETIDNCSPEESLQLLLKRLTRRWKSPPPVSFKESLLIYKFQNDAKRSFSDRFFAKFDSLVLRVFRKARLLKLVPGQPAPFGLFVTFVKK
jgi:SAM-dependent methyltransferase